MTRTLFSLFIYVTSPNSSFYRLSGILCIGGGGHQGMAERKGTTALSLTCNICKVSSTKREDIIYVVFSKSKIPIFLYTIPYLLLLSDHKCILHAIGRFHGYSIACPASWTPGIQTS